MGVALRLGLPVLVLAVVLASCELLGPGGGDPVAADSRIEFKSVGGFAGIVWHDLTISEDGLVTNRAVTPNLTRQLSPDEHRLLLSAFDGFVALPDVVGEYICTDDVLNEVTVHQHGEEHTSAIWGCALSGDERGQNLERMRRIVSALAQLSRDMYDTQAPWRDLEVEFSTDRQAYHPGDPITVTARVRNPTSGERSLFFGPGAERLGISVYRRDGSGFSFEYPPSDYWPVQEPFDEVVIGPGEEKTFELVWNGIIPSGEEQGNPLTPGEYALTPYLWDTSGRFHVDFMVITVTEG